MPRHWMQDVSEVFDTNPRNGTRKETVWLTRRGLERQLEDSVFTRGKHICVDGCSGSGKSSLVLTTLLKHQLKFTMVQITRGMTWQSFCRQLIHKPRRPGSVGVSGEWAGLLPTLKLDLKLGHAGDDKLTHEHWEALIASADQHHVAQALAEQDCVLLLDEFERASPELATRVSEVIKILSQTYPSEFAKVIVLGADDVYKKLYDAYSTLDNRLVQINIPTLPSPSESWRYLRMGFEKLKMYHPGNSQYASREDLKEAVQCIYFAADGLFKSLTELGIDICREVGPQARAIRLPHIQRVCKQTEERNFAKYRTRFADLHRLAEKLPTCIAVILHMNNKGLGDVHEREEIEEALSDHGRGLVHDAILALWKDDFLVITGANNEKLFIKNPSWAHTLRVYMSDPGKRRKLEQHLNKPLQFHLDMGFEWEKLDTDHVHGGR